jgi:H+-translocating NAD(P) transhydrogenase subunit alpha
MSDAGQPTVVGVPKETAPGEHRVALVPAAVPALTKAGLKVVVEAGAGVDAGFLDDEYVQRGAELASDRAAVFSADIVLQVAAAGAVPDYSPAQIEAYREGQYVIAMCDPLSHPQAMADLAGRKVNCFSLELVPRITRAQSMDVLSSMATVAGYKAVLIAANTLPRLFPMLMTAAGTITPARVLVVGVGVAGLQAIATARRLGALVQAYDIRPAVKEQVESLGAKFVELPLETGESETAGGYAKAMDEEFYRKQRELMTKVVGDSDVVVTTAAIPGKKAPVLVTAEMVRAMKPGSVIVDLAAERGGNCELTKAGETVNENGVQILGPLNVPSTVAYHASQMYAKNISTFLLNLMKDGRLELNREDEIVSETLVTLDGEVVQARVKELLSDE